MKREGSLGRGKGMQERRGRGIKGMRKEDRGREQERRGDSDRGEGMRDWEGRERD